MVINIDGKKVGKVGNGKEVRFDVSPGTHAIQIGMHWMKSESMQVNVEPGETVTLECRTAARLLALGLRGVEIEASIRRVE
jgi:hypothetical protein